MNARDSCGLYSMSTDGVSNAFPALVHYRNTWNLCVLYLMSSDGKGLWIHRFSPWREGLGWACLISDANWWCWTRNLRVYFLAETLGIYGFCIWCSLNVPVCSLTGTLRICGLCIWCGLKEENSGFESFVRNGDACDSLVVYLIVTASPWFCCYHRHLFWTLAMTAYPVTHVTSTDIMMCSLLSRAASNDVLCFGELLVEFYRASSRNVKGYS